MPAFGVIRYTVRIILKRALSMSQLPRCLSVLLNRTVPVCEEVAEWLVFLLAHSASVSVSGPPLAPAFDASGLKLV